MSGQDQKTGGIHVHKRHHQALVGRIPVGACALPHFIAIVQRRLVAVVSIGDDELLIIHRRLNLLNGCRVRNLPQTVDDLIFVPYFHVGRAILLQCRIDCVRPVAIEHEDLAEMRLRCAQQIQTIGLRFAERLLVAEDDLLVVVLKLSRGNKPSAFQFSSGRVAGDLKSLGIEINAGLLVLRQNLLRAPVF